MGEASRRKRASTIGNVADHECYRLMADVPIILPAQSDPAMLPRHIIGPALNDAGRIRRDVRKLQADGICQHEAVFQSLERAWAEVSSGMEAIRAVEPKITCSGGCAACCYQTVDVSLVEAVVIGRWLLSQPKLHEPVRAEAAKLAGRPVEHRYTDPIRCPLLTDSNHCHLYQLRPFTCRAFLSSERHVCEAALKGYLAEGVISDLSWLEIPQIIGRLYEGAIDAATADMGLQAGRVDLVETLATILEQPAIIDAWIAGGKPFQAKKFQTNAPTRL